MCAIISLFVHLEYTIPIVLTWILSLCLIIKIGIHARSRLSYGKTHKI